MSKLITVWSQHLWSQKSDASASTSHRPSSNTLTTCLQQGLQLILMEDSKCHLCHHLNGLNWMKNCHPSSDLEWLILASCRRGRMDVVLGGKNYLQTPSHLAEFESRRLQKIGSNFFFKVLALQCYLGILVRYVLCYFTCNEYLVSDIWDVSLYNDQFREIKDQII